MRRGVLEGTSRSRAVWLRRASALPSTCSVVGSAADGLDRDHHHTTPASTTAPNRTIEPIRRVTDPWIAPAGRGSDRRQNLPPLGDANGRAHSRQVASSPSQPHARSWASTWARGSGLGSVARYHARNTGWDNGLWWGTYPAARRRTTGSTTAFVPPPTRRSSRIDDHRGC